MVSVEAEATESICAARIAIGKIEGAMSNGQQSGLFRMQPTTGAQYAVGPLIIVYSGVAQ